MKIQYLGTAAAEGWPALFCNCEMCKQAAKLGGKNIRTRSQAIVDNKILIDFPADTYAHMLQYRIDLPSIHTLLVTHSHIDHWYPEDLMRRSKRFATAIDETLHIYGNDAVYEELTQVAKRVGDGYKDVRIEYHIVKEFEPFEAEGYEIVPLKANHKPGENCYIYMISKDGQSLLYGHDTGYFPEETWAYIKDKQFDMVSLDCTMISIKAGINHMGILDNIEVVNQLKALGCVKEHTKYVVNHFSHNGKMLHDELETTARKNGFIASYDGMIVEC